MTKPLLKTNLYDWHVAHGGRMVPFAGWEMPVQYPTGPKVEHLATRSHAGLFDIDHMGQFAVSGPDADAYLNRLTSWDARTMANNDAHYALMCYPDGTIVDDIYLYRLPNRWFVAVNAANRAKDLAWMQAQTNDFDVMVTDVSDETYMLALQGPNAMQILQKLTPMSVKGLRRFTIAETQVDDVNALVSRTGYTGEDGVELFFPATAAVQVWTSLLEAGKNDGITPVGLAARDSLRFEPGFALYGHEISASITPAEARLNWVCHYDTNFIGRDAILKQKLEGPSRLLAGFQMVDKGVPRDGYAVVTADGDPIGEVVSGMFAPTLEKFAGHAFLPAKLAKSGTEIYINIRNKPKKAVVVRRPMYRPSYRD